MADVFVSYAHADRGIAESVVAALRNAGLDVWSDRNIEPGAPWSPELDAAIRACRCVVVLWSKESIASTWVLKEARFAEREAKLVPAIIDGVHPPLEFDHVQAADLTSWNGDPADPRFSALLRAVRAAVGRERAPDIDAERPLALLDLADAPRVDGAPALEDVEREIRHAPERKAFLRRRNLLLAAVVAGIAMFVAGAFATHHIGGPLKWLVTIVAFIGGAGGLIAGFIVLGMMRSDVSFPGWRARRDGGDGEALDTVPANEAPPLVFVTEHVEHALAPGGAEWDLTIYFSVFNRGSEEAVIFDGHANVYLLRGQDFFPATIGYRESLVIHETNSILRGGKRVTIEPGRSESLRLRLRLSRSVGMEGAEAKTAEQISSLFGIFIDVHWPRAGGIVDYRLPSDALYWFHSDTDCFDYVTPRNAGEWVKRGRNRASFGATVLPLLRRHNAAVSRLTPHVETPKSKVAAWIGRSAGSLALALYAIQFVELCVVAAAFLVNVSSGFALEIGGTSPPRVRRFGRDSIAPLAAISEAVRRRLGDDIPDTDLGRFFRDDRYATPTVNRHWRPVTQARDDELPPWFPPSARAALLRARAEAGFTRASEALVLLPEPRFATARQPRGPVLVAIGALATAVMIVVFGAMFTGALRSFAANRDGRSAVFLVVMSMFAALVSAGVGPDFGALVATLAVGMASLAALIVHFRFR